MTFCQDSRGLSGSRRCAERAVQKLQKRGPDCSNAASGLATSRGLCTEAAEEGNCTCQCRIMPEDCMKSSIEAAEEEGRGGGGRGLSVAMPHHA